jgi:hypothetical protein
MRPYVKKLKTEGLGGHGSSDRVAFWSPEFNPQYCPQKAKLLEALNHCPFVCGLQFLSKAS